jgi:hypothetical protein
MFNHESYLRPGEVVSASGSWIATQESIRGKDWRAIAEEAREAMSVFQSVRSARKGGSSRLYAASMPEVAVIIRASNPGRSSSFYLKRGNQTTIEASTTPAWRMGLEMAITSGSYSPRLMAYLPAWISSHSFSWECGTMRVFSMNG